MSELLDLIGHLLYASIFWGLVLLNAKNKWGWLWRFTGELGWCVIGWTIGMTSIWVWGLIFAAVDIRGFLKWRKDAN